MMQLLQRVDAFLAEHPPGATDPVEFLRAEYDAGLAWVHYPVGYGGSDAPIDVQAAVDDRFAAAQAPPSGRVTNPIGAGQCAATVLAYGSEEQKQRYLPALFTGVAEWCQLFSEPGSGSDLASLATRAIRDGSEWVVSGQKVWTSGATTRATRSCWHGPTPKRRSTPASPRSPSTSRHRGWRSGRSAR